jgi:endonuclease/exonuclease/phosphatase family metal-dependent hydrolase
MNVLRVMTLNVRQPDKDDGPNAWEFRRDLLLGTILAADPDLIGTQELFQIQADYFLAHAPAYSWFGSGRFGDTRDKHVGIFYRRDALKVVTHGDFWLSETPEVPGSSSWDIIRPRQVTWGCFESLAGERFYHFNTHFPYRSVEQEARRRTACLLRQRIEQLDPLTPVLLTADFNSPAGGEIHQMLTESFQDAWIEAEQLTGPESTLNGFGRFTGGPRIDWILFRSPWRVLEVETIERNCNGVYPSDHFPVLATFDTTGLDTDKP